MIKDNTKSWGKDKISKILLRLAPPVMLAQLIQALYNIVDSLFVGRFSESGLTALSIIYPLQLLMIALAVGIGVGINTIIAAKLGQNDKKSADEYGGMALPIEISTWFIFALISFFIMPLFANLFSKSIEVINDVIIYGRITSVFSFGLFLESAWTKVIQANGDMKTPMFAQIVGAIINIVLDPILIFGLIGFPKMGIAGAAIATVIGQIFAAIIVFFKGFRKAPSLNKYLKYTLNIIKIGLPNILMQAAYTVYIFGLNVVLETFSDQAVTALGLYYKWQTFFFIPLGAMQACIVPLISYNYANKNFDRCKRTLFDSIIFGLIFMAIGTTCFLSIPSLMLKAFTSDPEVIRIGTIGFRFIGISFLPMVTSLIFPVFFQAIGLGIKSSLLTIIRTVILFVPLGYLFSLLGLNWFWLTFPITETLTTIVGVIFYISYCKKHHYKIIHMNVSSTN